MRADIYRYIAKFKVANAAERISAWQDARLAYSAYCLAAHRPHPHKVHFISGPVTDVDEHGMATIAVARCLLGLKRVQAGGLMDTGKRLRVYCGQVPETPIILHRRYK